MLILNSDVQTQASTPVAATARHRRRFSEGSIPRADAKPTVTPQERRKNQVVDRFHLDVSATDKIFLENSSGSYLASPQGHFHKLSPRHVEGFQRPYAPAVCFTPRGLFSMRQKYGCVNGAPPFLRAILHLDVRSQELRALVHHPELSPYFPSADGFGGFLVINNRPYDSTFQTHAAPKAQKLNDDGIHLCAWFIHPEEASADARTRALLAELTPKSGDNRRPKKARMLQHLRALMKRCDVEVAEFTTMGNKPNRHLSRPLTSVLDLRARHAAVLADLQSKLTEHLRQAYGVDADQDQVDMFCHWPFRDVTTPLHVQVRVNQTLHPTDASSTFSLNALVTGLRRGRRAIDAMVLRRQHDNGGCFYRSKVEFSEFGNLKGVGFTIKKNVFRFDANARRAQPAQQQPDEGLLAPWLHDNRVFGVPIHGSLKGTGADAVLQLKGMRYGARQELGRGYSSTATLFQSDAPYHKVVVKSLRSENTGKHQIVLYKEYTTLRHLNKALSTLQRDTVVLPMGVVVGDDNMPSLVFPYHAGGGLASNTKRLTRLVADNKMTARERLELTKLMMLDIVKSKQTLEHAGVVHIDPRDDNFVLGLDGRTRLIDFGCAELISARTGPLPREALERNLELPVSYHSGDNLRPPGDTEVGPLFDSYVIGGVFVNLMRPITDAKPETSDGTDGGTEALQVDLERFADLRDKLLSASPSARLNAEQMLAHPFFATLQGNNETATRTQMQRIVKQAPGA